MALARSYGFRLNQSRQIPEFAVYHRFMGEALAEARTSMSQGGVPVGSILVRNGKIIGRGHNQRIQKNSPILHGEMDCILNAGRQASYLDTTIYTTLSPCMMCSGTIVQFKIPCVVIGENRNFGGNEHFLESNNVRVILLDDEQCRTLMEEFINAHKELWSEDIGVPGSDTRVAV